MTAAQELIVKIKKRIPFFQYSVYQDDFDMAVEKEKEQICNAYTDGLEGPYLGAEEYYNQTYNKKEK